MAIPKRSEQLLAAAAATATPVLNAANDHSQYAVVCKATGGAWDFTLESSPDGGTTWLIATATLSLLAGETDTIYLNAPFAMLRLNAVRTGGTADAWVTYSDPVEV